MSQIHTRRPIGLWAEPYGYIGEPLLSFETGRAAVKLFHYLNQWCGCYQILHFNQDALSYYPHALHGDSPSIDGHYYICIPAPPKADDDVGYTKRQLHGGMMVWYGDTAFDGTGQYTDWPKVTWQQDGGDEETLWQTYSCDEQSGMTVNEDEDLPWSDVIQLGGIYDDSNVFLYTPDATGGWIYGRIKTHSLRTAALGVWAGPDWNRLTNKEAQIKPEHVAPGRIIRGYNTTPGKQSFGNLIHLTGTGVATADDLFMNTKRCLFGWAHGVGVWTDTASYNDLGRSDTTYKVTRQRHNATYESANFEADVAVVVSCDYDGSNDAYLKISSVNAADSIEWTFSADTDGGWGGGAGLQNPEMFTNAEADGTGTLELASAGDEIKIDIGADGTTEMMVHAIYIFDRSFDD